MTKMLTRLEVVCYRLLVRYDTVTDYCRDEDFPPIVTKTHRANRTDSPVWILHNWPVPQVNIPRHEQAIYLLHRHLHHPRPEDTQVASQLGSYLLLLVAAE